jgi:hypothetical protein
MDAPALPIGTKATASAKLSQQVQGPVLLVHLIVSVFALLPIVLDSAHHWPPQPLSIRNCYKRILIDLLNDAHQGAAHKGFMALNPSNGSS